MSLFSHVTKERTAESTATSVRPSPKPHAPRRQKITSVDELHLTQSAEVVLEKRYLRRDPEGRVMETAIDMFRRVAENIASANALFGANTEDVKSRAEEYYDMMTHYEFLSGMPLRNAGRELQQLSACYVLPLGDSMDDIYTTLKNAAFLHKTGAGIGYDFSPLRPRGDLVKSTGNHSSGPVSFMRLFNFSSETIVNSAATRRAGNMGVLRVDHPDIEEFINIKQDNAELQNFNISVAATDVFMDAVKNDTDYDLINPSTGEVVRRERARKIFDKIAFGAWASAEPGLLFMDKIDALNPTPHVGQLRATNQCGEQPLLAYENCNLGSINLGKFVVRDDAGRPSIDWDRLRTVTRLAVEFLDNTVEINNYLLPEIEKTVKYGNRKIGLGVMGFADMLIRLGIPYNTDEAVQFADEVMGFVKREAHQMSIELGESRGDFPNFKGSLWEKQGYTHMRNATVTTIAPTGTIAIFANCSSGIEPIFALAFIRKNILDFGEDEFLEVNPLLEEIAKERWFYSRDLMKRVAEQGSLEGLKDVPDDLRRVFVTAHEIDPVWHVRIQAAFQKYTDNAVSKTINMPKSSTQEDVANALILAYDLGCKGITIYRDQSRSEQVLNTTKAHA
ncbi:MAG: adenosylcobalamin-dependent ribonucleoside-diphosphate reductase [Candidatus Kerfeldbacteria bacterium]|nr:adenosylcobalamin-dependent ribonucleoside-diphosphate reductase [Candidatus Kerfeldbacteria bacterium]